MIFVAAKELPKQGDKVLYERMTIDDGSKVIGSVKQRLDRERYFEGAERPWRIFADKNKANPVDRMHKQFPSLGSVATVLGAATVSEAYEIQRLIVEQTTTNGEAIKNN